MTQEAVADVRDRYARFARDEAPGRSDLYAEWAAGVAGDDGIAAALAVLTRPHRQPPLVFAVARMLGAPEAGFVQWSRFFLANADRIVTECASRSIQTNDPLRCVPMVHALGGIDGPIALIEVGASAGLCLLPDRYAYEFRTATSTGMDTSTKRLGAGPVRLVAELRGGTPAPVRLPDIAWRAGVDLEPRDARDPADRSWIAGLVWPGEHERAVRIGAALDVVAVEPPIIVQGDASEPGVLDDIVARAPSDATVVVTTPGVLPHVPRGARGRLIDIIRGLDARWVTLDSPRTHDAWSASVDPAGDGFVLALDGQPIARADPLGAWLSPLTGDEVVSVDS